MSIEHLNQLERECFTNNVAWVFENSPWVSERLWHKRPFASVAHIRIGLEEVLTEATEQEQFSLIRAHPDLGSRKRMSTASELEQQRVGLQTLSIQDHQTIQTLNQLYREKFDFPFIFAVHGKTTSQVIDALQLRLQRTLDAERQQALREILQIAYHRLTQFLDA